jgi:hypothetical protein
MSRGIDLKKPDAIVNYYLNLYPEDYKGSSIGIDAAKKFLEPFDLEYPSAIQTPFSAWYKAFATKGQATTQVYKPFMDEGTQITVGEFEKLDNFTEDALNIQKDLEKGDVSDANNYSDLLSNVWYWTEPNARDVRYLREAYRHFFEKKISLIGDLDEEKADRDRSYVAKQLFNGLTNDKDFQEFVIKMLTAKAYFILSFLEGLQGDFEETRTTKPSTTQEWLDAFRADHLFKRFFQLHYCHEDFAKAYGLVSKNLWNSFIKNSS